MVNVAEKDSGFFDEMYQSTPFEVSSFKHELNQYLSEPIEPKATNILSFWRSQATMFPTLEVIACKYLAIPATSAPSERIFSGGQKILTYQRASLSVMHVERLACLKSWLCTFGPLYSSDN
ncbi:hypothetical protein O181_004459 [Austropuccinia psidii MF-1]|uniref:HAT C-terminal dimerisation domain-containing protein n=1 Tax=Austropuccinia psidii MF-1 TaxID=1389203 RepID=A0A9Q3BFV8_9BASI|nr:hypothetical protein [Austropuccinia psidii MF-1]